MSERARAARFERLVLPHLDAAWRLARWLARDPSDAEDLVQESFARAWRFFDTLRGEDARPWLLQILRNQWRSRLRAELGRPRAVAWDDSAEEAERALADEADEDDGPEALLLRIEDRRLIEQAMAALPPELGEVLVLREVEDMSYRDLAEVIGSPIGTVMSRLSRARRQLAVQVQRLRQEAGDGAR